MDEADLVVVEVDAVREERAPVQRTRPLQSCGDAVPAAGDGVTLNTLLPGRIATDRLYELYGSRQAADEVARAEIPAKRLGSPAEFAAAAAFLCSNQASYITGETIAVDGGMTRSVF